MDTLEGLYDTPIFNQMMAELKLEEDFQESITELRVAEPVYAQMLEDQFYKENNMEPMQRKVIEMRKAMDLPVPETPRTLSPAEAALHIKMIRDEFEEEFVPAFENQDLVEMYDAGIDVIVYVMGALSNAGLDIEPGFFEVMRSNMSKMDPETGKAIKAGPNDPDGHPEGKVLKGPNYSPPRLESIINEQFLYGHNDNLVYRTTDTPITLGIGGPQIGKGNLQMDHDGNVIMRAVIEDLEHLPVLESIAISDISVAYPNENAVINLDEFDLDHNHVALFTEDPYVEGRLTGKGEQVVIHKAEPEEQKTFFEQKREIDEIVDEANKLNYGVDETHNGPTQGRSTFVKIERDLT